jgi:phage terminase small subunit
VKKEIDPIDDLGLTEKNKIFAREYIFDWNGTRAYMAAYPDCKTSEAAKVSACRLLTNDNLQQYIKDIQMNLEELAGISRLKVISEHMKLAFSSIAHLHNTWIDRKDFELLTKEQKDCIAEIDTKIKTEYEYDPDSDKKQSIRVESIRIKLYDKQKALDSISKMLGFDAANKLDVSVNIPQMPTVIIKTRLSAASD